MGLRHSIESLNVVAEFGNQKYMLYFKKDYLNLSSPVQKTKMLSQHQQDTGSRDYLLIEPNSCFSHSLNSIHLGKTPLRDILSYSVLSIDIILIVVLFLSCAFKTAKIFNY